MKTSEPLYTESLPDTQANLPLSKALSDNLNIIHSLFSSCNDVIYREFIIDSIKCSAVLIFISGLVDIKLILVTIFRLSYQT